MKDQDRKTNQEPTWDKPAWKQEDREPRPERDKEAPLQEDREKRNPPKNNSSGQ